MTSNAVSSLTSFARREELQYILEGEFEVLKVLLLLCFNLSLGCMASIKIEITDLSLDSVRDLGEPWMRPSCVKHATLSPCRHLSKIRHLLESGNHAGLG